MKKISLLALAICLFFACNQDTTNQDQINKALTFEVLTSPQDYGEFKNLRIYPILATNQSFDSNTFAANLVNLKTAIPQRKFNILEKKPYGRFQDPGAVNMLTVGNKTQDAVFLMAGDVVQGGKQDRVIAENRIIASNSLTDVSVFCVEQGRWDYHLDEADASEDSKPVVAFNSYFNVASSNIRKTAQFDKDQERIWSQVDEITAKFKLQPETRAYTSLQNAEAYQEKLNQYLTYFKNKFGEREQMVGVVAVSGDEILGTDIFGHPDLFQQQYESLLHSYITTVIDQVVTQEITQKEVDQYANRLQKSFYDKRVDRDIMFTYQGQFIHYSK